MVYSVGRSCVSTIHGDSCGDLPHNLSLGWKFLQSVLPPLPQSLPLKRIPTSASTLHASDPWLTFGETKLKFLSGSLHYVGLKEPPIWGWTLFVFVSDRERIEWEYFLKGSASVCEFLAVSLCILDVINWQGFSSPSKGCSLIKKGICPLTCAISSRDGWDSDV